MNLCHVTFVIVILISLRIKAQEETSCGKLYVHPNALITNGFQSNEGEWPWHAALYHYFNLDMSYKCGGTLITASSILTAAHCVYSNNEPIAPERVVVYLGRHNLRIFATNTQALEAYNIIPHPDYNSIDQSNDIAIIRLAYQAILNNYVQPICLWDSNNLELSEVVGRLGTVIGYGVTETDQLSPILQQAFMPVVPSLICLQTQRDFFGAHLSEKNFCAGFRNGTSVCNGDSGGSMSFEKNGLYYIRGIVSVTVARKDSRFCDTNHYVIFTDVAQYLLWIGDVVPQLKLQASQGINLNCGRRSLQHTALTTNGFQSKKGDWPWHAGIFHIGIRQDVTYKCGGTVLSSNFILSAAHCVYENDHLIINERISVNLGANSLIDSDFQHFEVQNVIPHPNYIIESKSNDISIIRLATEAIFNNYVQPICLWDLGKADIADVTGRIGSVVGWGSTNQDHSYVLRQSFIPIVSHSTCLSSNSDFFRNYLTERTFCAGFRDGTNVCNGDSGGSLTLEEGGVYYIRGIVSWNSPRTAVQNLQNTKFCSEYVVFTDVVQYIPWIQLVASKLRLQPLEIAAPAPISLPCPPAFVGQYPNCIAPKPTDEDEMDWRNYGAVTAVKDAGICGSSWAIAAIDALESHFFIHKSVPLKMLSVQQLIDCTTTFGNDGCNKGSPHNAFWYAETYGIDTADEYPYEARDGQSCRHQATSNNLKIQYYRNITDGNDKELKEVVKNYGPVVGAIHASSKFKYLTSPGVFTCETGPTNHAVLIIGYGYDSHVDLHYWLIKNSFGTNWGDRGYAKISQYHCTIAVYASYPIV